MAGTGLEENRLGSWFGLGSRVEAAVFSFSRRAGACVRPVHLGGARTGVGGEWAGALGYALDASEPERLRRPLLAGALVVRRADAERSDSWRLYAVRAAYGAAGGRGVQLSEL